MCGIVGIIGEKASEINLTKMLVSQSHRGPDFTGKWLDNFVGFGHNRLSIIDLSENAHQPFIDSSGEYILVFNGEIYNYLELKKELISRYKFTTKSDSEVLLAAYITWGKECLHKLNGMFSFAIWHIKEKKLFAARDRFGVKPFFYHQHKKNFYFASEIKAIHATSINKKPNKKVWANYFGYGSYGMPNETFWEGIYQLPAGHYLELKKHNELTINKWYFFENQVLKYKEIASLEKVKQQYDTLLKESIKLRFRSDVSVGFNVSGGVDSSLLLAYVNQLKGKDKIEAFTFYTNDTNYDELPWVEKLVNITNNPLEKVLLTAKETETLASKIAYHQDEPFGGLPTLAYAKIFEKAREKNILVLLDGQGMDEQWAGYDYYLKNNNEIIQGVKASPFKQNVLSDEFLECLEKPNYPKPFDDELLNKQYRDLFYTKIPRALRFNDRISMAYGTELREPFLDYRLVELAFVQPLEYKIQNGVQKSLIRQIASDYLGNEISYAPKRPLQTPQREWLANELKEFVENAISNIANSEYANWFKLDALKKEWKLYLQGENDSSFHIWQWINLSLLIEK